MKWIYYHKVGRLVRRGVLLSLLLVGVSGLIPMAIGDDTAFAEPVRIAQADDELENINDDDFSGQQDEADYQENDQDDQLSEDLRDSVDELYEKNNEDVYDENNSGNRDNADIQKALDSSTADIDDLQYEEIHERNDEQDDATGDVDYVGTVNKSRTVWAWQKGSPLQAIAAAWDMYRVHAPDTIKGHRMVRMLTFLKIGYDDRVLLKGYSRLYQKDFFPPDDSRWQGIFMFHARLELAEYLKKANDLKTMMQKIETLHDWIHIHSYAAALRLEGAATLGGGSSYSRYKKAFHDWVSERQHSCQSIYSAWGDACNWMLKPYLSEKQLD